MIKFSREDTFLQVLQKSKTFASALHHQLLFFAKDRSKFCVSVAASTKSSQMTLESRIVAILMS